MYEAIKQQLKAVQAANVLLEQMKPEFKAMITDKTIPLDERWDMWLAAPNSVKVTHEWISAGRLECFRLLGYEPRDAIAYEGGLVWAERHQTFVMPELLDSIIESYCEGDAIVEELEELGLTIDWDQDYDDIIAKSPRLSAFVVAYKEEALAANLHAFEYDW